MGTWCHPSARTASSTTHWEDFTESGQRCDLILDNVGNHSLSALRGVLNSKGICVIAGAPKNPSRFIAAEALGYLEKGHAQGKVVIDLGSINKA